MQSIKQLQWYWPLILCEALIIFGGIPLTCSWMPSIILEYQWKYSMDYG
jgi:hypothetical protein